MGRNVQPAPGRRIPELRTPWTALAAVRGHANVHEMRHHPDFFPLQGDPRFEALLNDPKNNAPLY